MYILHKAWSNDVTIIIIITVIITTFIVQMFPILPLVHYY